MGDRKDAFQLAADRVVTHLATVRWLDWLRVSGVYVFTAAALGIICLRVTGNLAANEIPWTALVLVSMWVSATLVMAHWTRPSAATALARWDEAASSHDMFVSAWSFVVRGESGPGVDLHLRIASRELKSALKELPEHLPFPRGRGIAPAPVIFLALACVGAVFRADVAAEDQQLEEAEVVLTGELAERLEEMADELQAADRLSADEQKELEALKKELKESAKALKALETETPRELLEELERQARAAEKLAEKLGMAGKERIGSAMLAELERHADTTDLAGALRGDKLSKAADETLRLAKKLESDELSHEARDRIEDAFGMSLEAATKSDRKTALGRHLTLARKDLADKQPKKAAENLRAFARHLKERAQRKRTLQRLMELAKKLRQGGQKVLGRKQKGLRRLAQLPKKGVKRVGNQPAPLPFQRAPAQPQGMPQAGAPPGAQQPGAPVPGGQAPVPGVGRQGQARVPPPGAGKPGAGQAPRPGAGKPGQAPVPGQGAGKPGAGPMPGAGKPGAAPVPGAGQPRAGQGAGQAPGGVPGAGAGQGGQQAGTGSAPYAPNATKPHEATRTETVDGAKGEGPSGFRAVESQDQPEGTRRTTRELKTAFLKAEEEALADDPLPLSRREQVLRYFTALREQLEREK